MEQSSHFRCCCMAWHWQCAAFAVFRKSLPLLYLIDQSTLLRWKKIYVSNNVILYLRVVRPATPSNPARGPRQLRRERCSPTCVLLSFSVYYSQNLTICWNVPVICSLSTLPQLSVNIAEINHSVLKTCIFLLGVDAFKPKFYGNGVTRCQSVDTVRIDR